MEENWGGGAEEAELFRTSSTWRQINTRGGQVEGTQRDLALLLVCSTSLPFSVSAPTFLPTSQKNLDQPCRSDRTRKAQGPALVEVEVALAVAAADHLAQDLPLHHPDHLSQCPQPAFLAQD